METSEGKILNKTVLCVSFSSRGGGIVSRKR